MIGYFNKPFVNINSSDTTSNISDVCTKCFKNLNKLNKSNKLKSLPASNHDRIIIAQIKINSI